MVFQCFIQKDANFDMYFRIFTRIMVLTGELPPSRLTPCHLPLRGRLLPYLYVIGSLPEGAGKAARL
jgi:hypothetical protein